MLRNAARASVLTALMFFVACTAPAAKNTKYSEAANAFAAGVSSATDIVSKQLSDSTRSRRLLAIKYYVDNPDKPELNIGKRGGERERSFAIYVCVNADREEVTSEGLEYLRRYSGALQAAAKNPEANLSAIWTNTKRLRELDKPIPVDVPEENVEQPPADASAATAREKCEQVVSDLIGLPGAPLNPFIKEGIGEALVLYEGLTKLIESVKSAAVHVAQMHNDVERLKAFQEVVLGNSGNVAVALKDGAALQDQADLAWWRSRQADLMLPYALFTKMLSLNTVTERAEIFELAHQINGHLGPFDLALQNPPPADVLKAIRTAQDSLVAIAMDKPTAQDSVAALKAFAKELATLRDELGAVRNAGKNLTDQF